MKVIQKSSWPKSSDHNSALDHGKWRPEMGGEIAPPGGFASVQAGPAAWTGSIRTRCGVVA